MILFLYGQDTFRSRKTLHEMIEKFKKDRDPSGMNVARLNCEKEDEAREVVGQILTAPFLAEKRLVVVENLLVSKEADLRAELQSRIEKNALPESSVLILWEAAKPLKAKDQKALFEILKKEKYAQEFTELSGGELERWIGGETTARGGAIRRDAVGYLARHIGGDTWRLSSVIDQLIAYARAGAEARDIRVDDVRLFAEEADDDNIFNLTDAIAARQAKRAYELVREQYRRGQDSGYIYAMVLRQFRIMLELRDLFDREDGMTSDEMAKKAGVHPFVAKKTLPMVKRYSLQELQTVYGGLLDIDVKVKTGGGGQETLVDLLIAKNCLPAVQ